MKRVASLREQCARAEPLLKEEPSLFHVNVTHWRGLVGWLAIEIPSLTLSFREQVVSVTCAQIRSNWLLYPQTANDCK